VTIHFRQGSVGTHIRRGGQYILHIVGNLFRRHYAKNYRNQLTSDKVIAKTKRVQFLRHITGYCCLHWVLYLCTCSLQPGFCFCLFDFWSSFWHVSWVGLLKLLVRQLIRIMYLYDDNVQYSNLIFAQYLM